MDSFKSKKQLVLELNVDEGNLMIAGGVLFSRNDFEKLALFAKQDGLGFLSNSNYFQF